MSRENSQSRGGSRFMAAIWDDRLAEVWAAPGKAGSGVVIGTEMVLTARHVVAGALSDGDILSRVVKPGTVTADWVPMALLAEDEAWDVALLGVARDSGRRDPSGPRWLKPLSPSPTFAGLGTSAERHCEAVGFPQSEVQRTPEGDPVAVVRQSEQLVGTLLPAGQAKRPVNPDRPLPRRWMPFDVDGVTPGTQAGWGGMSGAGVLLGDGRIAALVVDAESGHQQRRLYVVPLPDVLAESGPVAQALAAMLGDPVVIEARDAPLYRNVLQDDCLAPDGLPMRVGEAGYKTFGAKPAGIPGEPAFLDYVPRDADQTLRDALQEAQVERRMLVVVGGSAGGKSRSAAEATRLHLPDHRLLCPRQTALARVNELPVADLGPALVWLDDAERYDERAFRDSIGWLLRSGVVVVATIRRTELERRMPKGDLRNPLGEVLTNRELAVQVAWPVIWNDEERTRVGEHVRYPALLAWVAAGKSPSAWVVAGPALQDRLDDAKADDEQPVRYGVVRTVLDWYGTGIAQPIPAAVIPRLLHAYAGYEPDPAEVEAALQWGFESVTGAGRITSQSLLAKTPGGDAVTVHDYIQDAHAQGSETAIADVVWRAALDEATSTDARYGVGFIAAVRGNAGVASEAWLPLAAEGDTEAMLSLGILFQDSDRDQAVHWFEKAAEAGKAEAMFGLGVLLADRDQDQALRWYEKAAEAGNADAMYNLGVLLRYEDPDQAGIWYQRAAKAGHVGAMYNLGLMLAANDPGQARRWLEKAAEAGHADPMYHLALLLKDSDPDQALRWLEKAAEAGRVDAMFDLGMLLANRDQDQAVRWFEKAAEAGNIVAMFDLGVLLADRDRDRALRWYEKAAEAGHAEAMYNLALLLKDGDPDQARRWYEKAAEPGHAIPPSMLRQLLNAIDASQARRRYEKAAEAGDVDAMFNLGLLLKDSDLDQTRLWFEKAAEAGQITAMNNLGLLLINSDLDQAIRWLEKAAEAGKTEAMVNLGVLLQDSDPDQARRWSEKAAERGVGSVDPTDHQV
jgi:TPR repeat protein